MSCLIELNTTDDKYAVYRHILTMLINSVTLYQYTIQRPGTVDGTPQTLQDDRSAADHLGMQCLAYISRAQSCTEQKTIV